MDEFIRDFSDRVRWSTRIDEYSYFYLEKNQVGYKTEPITIIKSNFNLMTRKTISGRIREIEEMSSNRNWGRYKIKIDGDSADIYRIVEVYPDIYSKYKLKISDDIVIEKGPYRTWLLSYDSPCIQGINASGKLPFTDREVGTEVEVVMDLYRELPTPKEGYHQIISQLMAYDDTVYDEGIKTVKFFVKEEDWDLFQYTTNAPGSPVFTVELRENDEWYFKDSDIITGKVEKVAIIGRKDDGRIHFEVSIRKRDGELYSSEVCTKQGLNQLFIIGDTLVIDTFKYNTSAIMLPMILWVKAKGHEISYFTTTDFQDDSDHSDVLGRAAYLNEDGTYDEEEELEEEEDDYDDDPYGYEEDYMEEDVEEVHD